MYSIQRSLAVARIVGSRYYSGYVPSPKFAALKKNQALFQTDDGLPIFLKAGTRDKILYQSTWVLLFTGMAIMLKLFFDLAKPTKN